VETIGVRELRQNASKYLRRVAAGESFTVTDRGVPVAVLGPAPEEGTLDDRMVAAGEIIPPEKPVGVLSGKPVEPLDFGFSASEELQRMRDEERW
jgi:prevent-host-death family protein